MVEKIFQKIKKKLPKVKTNISLAKYTTFKIGGKTKYFFIAKTKTDLILATNLAKKIKLPFFILGGGSNLLVSDKGFNGLVIKIENCKLKIENSQVTAEAGIPLSKLVNISVEKSLAGLEWAVGIPGTVGGAIYGNAKGFGKSMADVIKKVEFYNTKDQKIKVLKNKGCQFGYKDSIFKHKKNLIILSSEIQLKKSKKKAIQKKIKEYLNYRQKTQPLNLPSAGSIFKNPQRRVAGGWRPAGFLIDKCGLKGKKIGKAKVSEKHANFIVNLGGAQAKDVKKLINFIKKEIKKKFKIILEEEIQFLGF
jgi:UDP-N-acetylmuramate dehydrogenase